MRTLIVQIAEDLNITITENQMNELTALFMKMKDLNIDWNVVSDQLDKARENLTDFMKSDEAKSFLDGIIDALKGFFNSIRNLFSS